jgi:hypothetical protein
MNWLLRRVLETNVGLYQLFSSVPILVNLTNFYVEEGPYKHGRRYDRMLGQ